MKKINKNNHFFYNQRICYSSGISNEQSNYPNSLGLLVTNSHRVAPILVARIMRHTHYIFLSFTPNRKNKNLRVKILPLLWIKVLNFLNYIHTFYHLAKRCESLPVFIPFAAIIQRRLIIDANKKRGSGWIGRTGAGLPACDYSLLIPKKLKILWFESI